VITRRPTAGGAALLLAWLACLACKPTASPTPPPASSPASSRAVAATPPTRDALRGPIVAIDVIGTSRTEVRDALGTAVGAAYDPASIARDVHALWRLRGIADIQVDARPQAGGVALRYRIRELPRIATVSLEGGPILYVAQWRIRLAGIKDVPQDPTTLTTLAEEMRAELVSRAYLDAIVDTRIVEAGEDRVDVVFTVTEGPQVTLAALTLRGHKKLATAELTALLRSHGVAVGQPFTAARLDAARLGVLTRYQDLGNLNAEFAAVSELRSPDGATISATYELREGDTLRLGKLTVRGALLLPVREYEQLLGVRRGQPFNRSRVALGLEKIRIRHSERGGPPNITPLTEIDRKRKAIDLTIEISN
jgi:outer membrane protein insertion porin family